MALIDIAKGFLPAFLALRLFRDPVLAAACASLAVLGHCFPVYIGFRGGKGVATAAGAMFALAPPGGPGQPGRFRGDGRPDAATSPSARSWPPLLFPAFLAVFGVPREHRPASVPILALILIRHAATSAGSVRGTERKLGAKEAKNA